MSKKRDELAETFANQFVAVPRRELEPWQEEIAGHFKSGWDARDAEVKRLREALELCVRRMSMTAWVEDECFEKAEIALAETESKRSLKNEKALYRRGLRISSS